MRSTLRLWQDRLYSDVAADNYAARMADLLERQAAPRRGWTPEVGPRESEAEVRVWLAGTDYGREEVHPVAGDRWFPLVNIANGRHGWRRIRDQTPRWHNARGQTSHRAIGSLSYADRHFGRRFVRDLFKALDLKEIGPVHTAQHECVRVRAVPVPGTSLWPHWFPYGGDEYELHVDPERAAVLTIIGRVGRAVFETNEVIELVYDSLLDEKLFEVPQRGADSRAGIPDTNR